MINDEVADRIPSKYMGSEGSETLQRDIASCIRWLRRVRGLAVTWSWFIVASFVLLARDPGPEIGGTQSRPALVGAAVLSAGFALLLSWRSQGQHRSLAARTESVTRWMVATGVTVAFAVAVSVRVELQFSFAIPGLYLIFTAPSFVSIHLLRLRLAGFDEIQPRTAAMTGDADQDQAPSVSIEDATVVAVRVIAALLTAGSLAWWRRRRSDA